MLSKDELKKHNIAQLKEICKESGISGYSKLKKSEIIDLILQSNVESGALKDESRDGYNKAESSKKQSAPTGRKVRTKTLHSRDKTEKTVEKSKKLATRREEEIKSRIQTVPLTEALKAKHESEEPGASSPETATLTEILKTGYDVEDPITRTLKTVPLSEALKAKNEPEDHVAPTNGSILLTETLKPKKKVESKPKKKAEPKPKQKTEPKPKQKAEPKPKKKAEPKPKEKVEPKPKQKAEPKPKKKAEPKPKQKAEPKPKQKVEPKPKQKVEPKPKQKVEPKPKQKVEPKPKQKVEPKPKQKVEPKPKQKTKSKQKSSTAAKQVPEKKSEERLQDLPASEQHYIIKKRLSKPTIKLLKLKREDFQKMVDKKLEKILDDLELEKGYLNIYHQSDKLLRDFIEESISIIKEVKEEKLNAVEEEYFAFVVSKIFTKKKNADLIESEISKIGPYYTVLDVAKKIMEKVKFSPSPPFPLRALTPRVVEMIKSRTDH
ncbi:MAG: Rho termination factor N-terminal domain-containing protein [Candidatus Hodarchaeota archaeon]